MIDRGKVVLMSFRKRTPKEKDQAIHARKRFYERYGMELSKVQYRELCVLLQSGNDEYCTTLYKQSCTRTVKSIEFMGETLYLVYDKLRHQIATFLTAEMIKQNTITNCTSEK